jgi:hypothetical protein
MKRYMLGTALGFGGILIWESARLHALREEVARLTVAAQEERQSAGSGDLSKVDRVELKVVSVSEAELADLKQIVQNAGEDFMNSNWFQFHDGEGIAYPKACDKLARLSTEQLRDILDSWPTDGRSQKERSTDIHRFMLSAGKVNPSATVPLMYELSEKLGDKVPGSIQQAFQHWFRKNPEELLKWAEQKGKPAGFQNECAVWVDAARALKDPSVENVRALASHKMGWKFAAFRELTAKLLTQDERLTFFTNLHAATEGKSDDLVNCLRGFIHRIPFSQAADISDKVPQFKPANAVARSRIDRELGSLRYEVALNSRDSTAKERWDWLTRLDGDRPSSKALSELVKAWCKNDYLDTAKWVRTLPPGTERQTIIASVIRFLQDSGANELVSEWTAM